MHYLLLQIAKNLVLAGVGHVSIADSTPCAQAQFGNFLVTTDASPQETWVTGGCCAWLWGGDPQCVAVASLTGIHASTGVWGAHGCAHTYRTGSTTHQSTAPPHARCRVGEACASVLPA